MSMEIYAIVNGNVLPYILDPNFEKYLPVIPSEVSYVNFTWKSGMKKYYYNFDRLQSFDEAILEAPIISIKTKGRVPKRPKEFSILLPCLGNSSGIAAFGIGLLIESRKGRPLNGTPLRLKLRKECSQRGISVLYAVSMAHSSSSIILQDLIRSVIRSVQIMAGAIMRRYVSVRRVIWASIVVRHSAIRSA